MSRRGRDEELLDRGGRLLDSSCGRLAAPYILDRCTHRDGCYVGEYLGVMSPKASVEWVSRLLVVAVVIIAARARALRQDAK